MPKNTTPPPPFSRPSVSIDTDAVKREWRNVYPDELSIGDLIADFGAVDSIGQGSGTVPGHIFYTLENVVGARTVYRDDHLLFAFTAVK